MEAAQIRSGVSYPSGFCSDQGGDPQGGRQRLRPDLVATALTQFKWAFRQPGRYLNASQVWEPGLEIEDARDDLEEVMRYLPRGG